MGRVRVCSIYGVTTYADNILDGKPEVKISLVRPGTHGRTLLKCALRKQDVIVWSEFIWCGVELSGKILIW
jgi:hypothetical protein